MALVCSIVAVPCRRVGSDVKLVLKLLVSMYHNDIIFYNIYNMIHDH